MSLSKIAQYLENQGRGEDKHLVHMTKGELQSLQELAQQHGGSLTINPHTGLPEAGFLSSILPMIAGAAMVALAPETGGLSMLGNPMVAGAIVGAGDAAITGSLQQGLIAGLSAYGGAGLASGLGAIGAGAADTATSALANQAGTSAGEEAVKLATTQGITEQAALDTIRQQAIDSGANATGQVANPRSLASIGGGLSNSSGTGITQSLSSLGNFAKNNVGALAGLGLGAYQAYQDSNKPSEPDTNSTPNPFGLKTIPKDANGNSIFNPSIPTPPAQPYQAQYTNYVQNPYNPMRAKSGGLMDVPKYAGGTDYGSMVSGAKELQQGLSQASTAAPLTPLQEQLIALGQRNSQEGIYNLSDLEYAKLSPKELMKKNKIDIAKGLASVGALGAYDTKPAAQLQAEAAAQADISKNQTQTSAKEGGLMSFAEGGSSDGQNATPVKKVPVLADYVAATRAATANAKNIQAPPMQANNVVVPPMQANNVVVPTMQSQYISPQQQYQAPVNQAVNQAASQAYMNQGIPTFSRPTSSGYAVDPMQMQGSLAMKQAQADAAAKAAQADADARAAAALQQQYQPAGYNADQGAGYAMGGGIGSYYPSPDDGQGGQHPQDTMMGAHPSVSMGPAYPMQGIKSSYATGGGINNLGNYSDGGRLLKGPGDGVSDGIPATINGRQPARLADGEFVIPARIVSELGNGSTDAGAKRLYAMMDRIKRARSKAKNIAADTKAYKYLPA